MRFSRFFIAFLSLIAFTGSLHAAPFQGGSYEDSVSAQGIPRLVQVDTNLVRGGRPATLADLQLLRDKGIKVIVDLENDSNVVNSEIDNAGRLGMQVISIPMGWTSAPSDADTQRILALMQGQAGGPVFIHCKQGKDRTGLMVGLYRVFVQKWAPQDAYREMLGLGFSRSLRALDNYFKTKTGMR